LFYRTIIVTKPPRLLVMQPNSSASKAATTVANAAPAAAEPASVPMTEAMIKHLVAKGKPYMSEWVAALQDTGTDKSMGQLAPVFNKIQRVSIQIAKTWKVEGASFIGTNVSRFAKFELTASILKYRKLFPKSKVDHDIKKHLPKDHKRHDMYMIENEIGSAGYNTWAYNIVTMLAEREWEKLNANAIRVPNDALRVSSIMMDVKYRVQMVKAMSNQLYWSKVKEDAGLDLYCSPEMLTAMYEDMVSDFNDPEYFAKAPKKAHLIKWDHGPLDPNEVKTVSLLGVVCVS
jgi:hypothetical protein